MIEPLLHYAAAPVILQPMAYEQVDLLKPCGLWFSVGDGWREWCERAKFRLDTLAVRHELSLKPGAKLLRLRSARGIDKLTRDYGHTEEEWLLGQINWQKVSERYQGIIIAPYCRERRHHRETPWYYIWDCASGCVWDLDAIASFARVDALARVVCETPTAR